MLFGCYISSGMSQSIENLIIGIVSGILSGLVVCWVTVWRPNRRRQSVHKEWFKRRFYVFRKRVFELMDISAPLDFEFTNKSIDLLLRKMGSDRITNIMNVNEKLFHELVNTCDRFFEFAKTFVVCVSDVNPSVLHYLESLHHESQKMEKGLYTSSDKQYYIDFVFDILAGTNYSYHACDIEQCVEHLFDTPKFNLQNSNKKNWKKNLRLGENYEWKALLH